MITVGTSRLWDKKIKKYRKYKYSDVPADLDKWVGNLKYRPIPFDLLYLSIKNLRKPKNGWWSGERWDGRLLKDTDEVVAWKRNLSQFAL
jgi:hypothetical protein